MNEKLEKFFQFNTDQSGIREIYPRHSYIKRPDKIQSSTEAKNADKHAVSEIEYLQNLIEILTEYRAELFNRFQEINSANFRLRISLERIPRYYQNIHYIVKVERVPDRADVEKENVLSERYDGKDRQKAIKRYEYLCNKNPNAEMIKDIKKKSWEK